MPSVNRRRITPWVLAPLLALAAPARAAASPPDAPAVTAAHEYASLRRVRLPLRDFTLRRVDARPGDAEATITLSRFAAGKKLILLAYFAPWCGNWRNQAPHLPALLRRYRDRGLDLLAVSEYAAHEDTQAFFSAFGGAPPYQVVFESESRDDRERTSHFALRQAAGDTRKWGSPFLIFFTPDALRDGRGEAWAVSGELIEAEVEQLLRLQLGPPTRKGHSRQL